MTETDLQKFRPFPFYFLNTGDMAEYTQEKIDAKVKELYDDGFGGAMLFNCAGNGFDKDQYLTEDFFTMTERFILAAEKYGLKIWVTDGWRCPSGDVGGKIEKRNPELYQRRLSRNSSGEVEPIKVPWGFPAFEEPESSDLFIELVYEAYNKHLGKYFGKTFQGIFSDADNRRFDAFVLSLKEEYYPWAIDFKAKFQKEYGYDITPFLSDIFDGKNFQGSYDYHCFCEKLYLNWFEKNYAWCKAHNLQYTFHTSDTGPFPRSKCRRSSIFTEGNPFHFNKLSDFPGTDHEFLSLDGGTPYDHRMPELKVSRGSTAGTYRNPNFADTKYDLRAKYVGSAAHIFGKEGAICELFACSHWAASPAEYRRIAAWQIFQGINRFIPHGIMHKFFPDGKYNCPPEQHLGTGGSIRQINDFLTKYSYISSQGNFAPSVKLEDISEAVRRGKEDVENFFTFTDMLNHAGISYLIVPEGDPEAIQIHDKLPELPQREFTFTGGDLLAMRRELNGEQFLLLLCNLWSEEELEGTLEFNGRKLDIALAPGEIAVIGSPFEEFRQRKPEKAVVLPFPAEVNFDAPNRVPFHYNSEFTISEPLGTPLKVLVAERFVSGFSYDGTVPEISGKRIMWNEPYVEYTVPATVGKHHFELKDWLNRPLNLGNITGSTGNNTEKFKEQFYALPVMLEGEFDTDLDVEGEFDHLVYGGRYSLQIHDPKRCDIFLKPRRNKLDAGSWAIQGQPFYSGSTVYRFDISKLTGNAVLETPYAGVKVEVSVDGKFCGDMVFPPYRMALGDLSGAKILEIKVTNTMSNEFEEYLAPSGLINGAILFFEE